MVKIIAVSSGKGGVGKTTLTANLGASLASEYNKNVVVVDCNLTNPHLGLSLGTLSFWPVTLNSVLKNEASINQAIHSHTSGLSIIPASFEQKDLKRLNMYKLRSRLRRLFTRLKADIVLLDSSPGLSIESLLTLRCADEVIFVATPHIPSIIDITKCCQALRKTDAKPIGIILNRVRGKNYEMSEDEVMKFTNLPILAKVPEDENVLRSTNFKSPVVSSFPASPSSREFHRLAALLVGETACFPEQGFMRRIFGVFRR